jgi:salicylate 5-hydroxylase large subunit
MSTGAAAYPAAARLHPETLGGIAGFLVKAHRRFGFPAKLASLGTEMDAPLVQRQWPPEGISRVPFWVYSDSAIYEREQQRIFAGPSWSYVGLAAEVPAPGDFKRTFIGDKSVVVVRDREGAVRVLVNRCAHRGLQFCQRNFGTTTEFMCPYHQWT